MAHIWFDVPLVVIEPGVRTGMPILYDNPKEVGADRVANAVGAIDLYGGPAIVVDLGTATTFDAISAAGEYVGGAITPGIEISMDALFEHAAALRRVELVEPRNVIGKSTVESIQSGVDLRLHGSRRRHVPPYRRGARALDDHRHRRAGRAHHAVVGDDPAPRAVAHLARASPRLRPQRGAGRGREGEVRGIGYRFETTSGAGDVARSYAHLEAGRGVRRHGRRRRPPDAVPASGQACLRRAPGLDGEHPAVRPRGADARTSRSSAASRSATGSGSPGEVVRTRRGELSVKVASWELLAQARRGFGDKWHGVNDPDIRYRQRELDLWANEGVRDIFLLRSKVVASIRRRLGAAGFVEVETPVLHPIAGGATARPFVTHYNALHADVYLRIATELYLKRCVVGGLERVFEIGRTFRNEGLSPRHNPEFTMLELYQAYADYTDMMAIFEDIVAGTAEEILGTTVLSYQGREIDLTPPWRRATLVELIAEHAGVEVDLSMGAEAAASRSPPSLGVPFEPWYGPGKLILEIYEKTTEAELWGPVFVCDYPQEVSPLARAHRSKPGYVERFEPIIAGRELGNAFSELTTPMTNGPVSRTRSGRRALGDEEAMSHRLGLPAGARARPAADGRPRARDRPSRDALRGRGEHPGGGAVPGAASRGAPGRGDARPRPERADRRALRSPTGAP